MATDIMATSTTKLTHPIRVARSFFSCFIKMRLASLGAGTNAVHNERGGVECHWPYNGPRRSALGEYSDRREQRRGGARR